ncbi:E3 ubiquitin-protein ligase ZNRF1-like [Rhopilema esculentum]|uniref:E3 ubiquitin-protein ligase ZNRF1-like n=1 Tax=Rhopilema esculentum TaxID=499914 RepID=UPI0031D65075|eukprot:gene1681-16157_t
MGGKQSTNSPNGRQQNRTSYAHTSSSPLVATGSDPGRAQGSHDRIRARTFNDINSDNRPLAVPRELFDQRYVSEFGLATASLQVNGRRRRRRERDDSNETNSLPSQLFSAFISELKCPVCNKTLHSDTLEVHLVECLSKPRICYNADVLIIDSGECVICFEEMSKGETIARLPCLCVYHKTCIDDWFKRSRTCPEHPEQPAPLPAEEEEEEGESEEKPELTSSFEP